MHATLDRAGSDVHTRWAAVLVRARTLAWSQNELARRLDRNPGHLSRVIRDDGRSSMRLLERAEALVERAGRKNGSRERRRARTILTTAAR